MERVLFFLLSCMVWPTVYGRQVHMPTESVITDWQAPRVWISNIPFYTTTKAELLANPLLVTDSTGCVVSGFSLSLQAPGLGFYGPLYANGTGFTDVQKEAINKWDHPKSTLFVQDIHLNCNGQDARAAALEYKFDH